jgi:RNA recognition motif-containing protein
MLINVLKNPTFQAKPCKHLWVGGICPTVSKEELEEEFLKFGKIEDFKFLRDRNTAFVEYLRLEDASQAMRNMNGKRIGGEQIRVDFLRSQPSRRVSLLFRNVIFFLLDVVAVTRFTMTAGIIM